MKVTTTDGKTFRLERENDADHALIDALDHQHTVHISAIERATARNERGGFENVAAVLVVDRNSPQALAGDAGRQALSALGQIISLGLGEATKYGHVCAYPADPQAQKEFAAGLVDLQLMLQVGSDVIGQQETMLKAMKSAHENTPFVEPFIVQQGGAS